MNHLPAFHFKKALLGSFLIAVFTVGLFVLILNKEALFNTEKVRAAVEDNVAGFAWSENIGWISMNNASDGSAISYGVNINADNTISGWAWSDNIGWICFGSTCDAGTYGNTPENAQALAQVNPANGEVSGWAKIIAYNDPNDVSGWIALRTNSADQKVITYGAKICLQDSCSYDSPNKKTTLTARRGQWYYWAWSDAIGWIDFGPQVGGTYVGVSTGWRPAKALVTPQGGIFEPLCYADGTTCPKQFCKDSDAGFERSFDWQGKDYYCDGDKQGLELKGTHLHTFTVELADLPAQSGKVSCTVKTPGRCQDKIIGGISTPGATCFRNTDCADGEIPPCGNGASDIILNGLINSDRTAKLSYTVKPTDTINKQAFWLLAKCQVEGAAEPIIINQPIFTHLNTWDSNTDRNKALSCWLPLAGKYFSNTKICNYLGDVGFSQKNLKGFPVEGNCYDTCTHTDETDENGLINCDNPSWKVGSSACCAPVNCSIDSDCPEGACTNDGVCKIGGLDNDANGLANAADPYCKGIIYGKMAETGGTIPCELRAGKPDICANVIGGYCDIPSGGKVGICKSKIINNTAP